MIDIINATSAVILAIASVAFAIAMYKDSKEMEIKTKQMQAEFDKQKESQ